jgi:hypothetical protein
MIGLFKLVDRMPQRCGFWEWAIWFENAANRHVGLTEIGCLRISTVFLGIDHNWGHGDPLLFETMIFQDDSDLYTDRCSTWEAAEAMHADAVAYAVERIRKADAVVLQFMQKNR